MKSGAGYRFMQVDGSQRPGGPGRPFGPAAPGTPGLPCPPRSPSLPSLPMPGAPATPKVALKQISIVIWHLLVTMQGMEIAKLALGC